MTDNSEKILIDTNIIVYCYDKDSGQKHVKAKKILQECFEGKKQFYISNQILSEFISVTKRKTKIGLGEIEIKGIIYEINKLNSWKKINYSNKTVETAISENGKDFWDKLIAATMKENGVYNIYTENTKDFEKIEGIKAVNPLQTKAQKT